MTGVQTCALPIFEHKFINYDNKKVSRLIADRGFTGADELAKMFLKEE